MDIFYIFARYVDLVNLCKFYTMKMKCRLQSAFLAEKYTCKYFSYVLYKIYYIKYDYPSFKLHSKSKLTLSFFLYNFLPLFYPRHDHAYYKFVVGWASSMKFFKSKFTSNLTLYLVVVSTRSPLFSRS